jgi:hypothetical protein
MTSKHTDQANTHPWKRIEPTIVSMVGRRTIISKVFIESGGVVHNFDTLLISIDDLIANARSYRMTDPAGVLLAYEKLMELKG